MRTSEFIACSMAFHIALLVAALLLPSPFPAPKDTDSGIAYVELAKDVTDEDQAGGDAQGPDEVTVPSEGQVDTALPEKPRAQGLPLKQTGEGQSKAAGKPSDQKLNAPSRTPPKMPDGKPSAPSIPQAITQAAPEPPRASQPPQVAVTALDRPGTSLKAEKGRINFKYQRGWPAPSMVKVGIASSGIAASWAAKADSGWIIVSPASGRGLA